MAQETSELHDWEARRAAAQTQPYYEIRGRQYFRIAYGAEERSPAADFDGPMRCHDCGVQEMDLHLPGCDWEECPVCHGQAFACNCAYSDEYEWRLS